MSDVEIVDEGSAERDIDGIIAGGGAEEPSPSTAARKARGRARGSSRTAARAQDDHEDAQIDAREVDDLLQGTAPKPGVKERSLGDLYAKWGIPRPDFKVQVWRLMPKFFPGGLKADGFYDEYQNQMYEENLMSEYGGGTLLVKVVGPHREDPRQTQVYESIQVVLGGEPNYERRPRAAKPLERSMPAPTNAATNGGEDPKLATAALGHMAGAAQQEREERHRVEDRAASELARARENLAPLVDAERRRADDVLAVERQRAEDRERHLTERITEERARADALARKMDDMETTRPSMSSQFREAAEIFKPNGEMAERMLTSVLEKHKGELDSMRASHQREVDSIRGSHASEIASIRSTHTAELSLLRESHQRDLENERQSGKRREERLEDQVKSERDERDRRVKMEQEERERDRVRHREQLDDKDRAWKERLQSAEEVQKQQAEARYSMAVNNYTSQVTRLEEDLSRLSRDNTELRAKVAEVGDAVSIVKRGEDIKEALGIKPADTSSGGGGIGLTPADDWKNTFAENIADKIPEIVDKLPAILQMIFGGGAQQQQQAQQQPQYTVGQVVRMQDGREMVVVPNPAAGPGALGMVPREVAARMQGHAPPRQLSPGQAPRPAAPQQGKKRKRREAVVNLADGLPPLPRPPWEDGDDDGDGDEIGMVPPAAAPQQRPAPAPMEQPMPIQATPVQQRELSAEERMVLQELAKLVHEAVSRGEEPEELVAKMGQYPAAIVQKIASYPPEQVAAGIREVQPTSAGASPEGQRFVVRAMGVLRATIQAPPG